MNHQWLLSISYLCFGLMVFAPIYLVVVRGRFWFAFFAAWFFMVAASHCSVYYGRELLDQGLVASASDTTTIGLTMISGWVLALPYCGVLILVRILLRRAGFIQRTCGAQDGAAPLGTGTESK